jgi:hypothetical protein
MTVKLKDISAKQASQKVKAELKIEAGFFHEKI